MDLRRIVFCFGALIMLAGIIGCGSSFGWTKEERVHTYKTVTKSEWRMAKDDFDNFMLMERRSRLTRWH